MYGIAECQGMERGGSDVTLTEGDNHWLTVECGEFSVKMTGMAASAFPSLPKHQESDVIAGIPADKLTGMLGKIRCNIAREGSRYTLNGVKAEIAADILRLVATDGNRLGVVAYHGPTGAVKSLDMLWSLAAVEQLLRLLKGSTDTVRIARDADGNQFFSCGGNLVIARPLLGPFPNWQAVMPKPESHSSVLSCENGQLSSALALVSQFADERLHGVRIELAKSEFFVLSASSTENGDARQAVPAVYAGGDLTFGINAEYLAEWLKTVNGSGSVRASFQDAQSAVLLETESAGGPECEYEYKTMIMPMRVN